MVRLGEEREGRGREARTHGAGGEPLALYACMPACLLSNVFYHVKSAKVA
jgi:hypothetical protein